MRRWLILSFFSYLFVSVLAMSAGAEEVKRPYRGLTFNANLELAEGSSLADGAVLMVHGTLAHNKMETIATLQGLLKEQGLNTLAINLSYSLDDRHGAYDCAEPHNHTPEAAIDEIAAWTGWLKERGAPWVALFGHSRGGGQVAWYQGQWKDPGVKALILLAPGFWDFWKASKRYEKRYGRKLAPLVEKAMGILKEGKPGTMMDAGFLYCRDAKVSVMSFLGYYGDNRRLNNPGVLRWIPRTPVLVIGGSDDKIIDDLEKFVPHYIKKDRDRFVMIDGADHFFRDLYAEDVADAVVGFLADKGLFKR